MKGSNNYGENISITHVIAREADGDWLWHWRGSGGGGALYGSGHRLKNIHVYHNWNSSVSSENAAGAVIDGARMHGAPNHCSVAANGTSIIRNAMLYNCQDYEWLVDTNGLTLEQVTLPGGGIGVSVVTGTLGPIIVRNSIFKGTFYFIRGIDSLPNEGCTWEKGSIMENNVISSGATIERCGPAPRKKYPILDYMAKCESGEFTDCMTIRNNLMVDDWKTVMKDGMWNEALADSWDVTLVPDSPAIDAGMVSGATADIVGVSRPQGSAFDIGAYEYCGSDCLDASSSSGVSSSSGSSSSDGSSSSGRSSAASPTPGDEPSEGCGCRTGAPAGRTASSLAMMMVGLLTAHRLGRRRARRNLDALRRIP
jgi:hypothetical protein